MNHQTVHEKNTRSKLMSNDNISNERYQQSNYLLYLLQFSFEIILSDNIFLLHIIHCILLQLNQLFFMFYYRRVIYQRLLLRTKINEIYNILDFPPNDNDCFIITYVIINILILKDLLLAPYYIGKLQQLFQLHGLVLFLC